MSAFDPSTLVSFLQGQGSSSPATPPFVAPPTPNTPPPPNPSQGVSDAGQGSQRIVGLKGYLGNILYGVGEQIKSTVGMPTEDEQAQADAAGKNAQQKLAQGAQQTQAVIANHMITAKQAMSPVTIPHPETGNPIQVPFSLAHPYIAAQAQASGKPYMVVPNVGLYDTQAGKLTPDDINTGITVTQPIAQHFNLPLQSVGQKIPLGQLAQLEQKQTQVPSLSVPGQGNNSVAGLSDLARPTPTQSQVPQSLQLLQALKDRGGLPPNMQALLDQASAPPIGAVPGAPTQGVQNIPSSLIQRQGGQIPQSAANNAAVNAPAAQTPTAGQPPIRLATVNGKQVLVNASGQPVGTDGQPIKKQGFFRTFAQGYANAEMARLGIPTDLQKQNMQSEINYRDAQTQLVKEGMQEVPFAVPDPENPGQMTTISLPKRYAAGPLGRMLAGMNRNQATIPMFSNNGEPLAIRQGNNTYALGDPNMPASLKPLADGMVATHQQRLKENQDAQNNKPDTAVQNKQRFQDVGATLAKEFDGNLPKDFYTNPQTQISVINRSTTLTPEQKQFAQGYLMANPTPASQALNVVLRGETYAAGRPVSVYDHKRQEARTVSLAEVERADQEEPGRYTTASYTPESIQERAVAKDLAAGKTKDQIVSFNALLGHVGDLNDGIEQLRNTKSPMINKPINWLKANAMGDPAVSNFIQRMEPVKKEYESFLLNNRALYEDDRQAADKIMNENLSPAQMQEQMKGFAHTAAVRLSANNDSYKRIKGKDIPDLLSDEADSTLRALGVGIPGYKTARTQPNTPPPETRVQIGAIANRADGTRWRFKGGDSKDQNNWEQLQK